MQIIMWLCDISNIPVFIKISASNIDVHHLSLNCCNNKFANESVMCFKSNLLWFEHRIFVLNQTFSLSCNCNSGNKNKSPSFLARHLYNYKQKAQTILRVCFGLGKRGSSDGESWIVKIMICWKNCKYAEWNDFWSALNFSNKLIDKHKLVWSDDVEWNSMVP